MSNLLSIKPCTHDHGIDKPAKDPVLSPRTALMLLTISFAMLIPNGLGSTAHAEQTPRFGFSITRPDDRVTLHFMLDAYDATGVAPPAPNAFYLRWPRGLRIAADFLDGRHFCDGPALRDALDRHPSGTPFTTRVADLRPFIRLLTRSSSKADRSALRNARRCERARLGKGTGLIDARAFTPVLSDPIPVHFSEFLSRGTAPSALASFAILSAADPHAPVTRHYPVVGTVHVALNDDIIDDPTPDGLYGYKVLLPTGRLNGFNVRVAKLDTTVRSLVLSRRVCVGRDRHERCTRRRRSRLFSFVAPTCPPTGQLSAQLFAGFPPPTPSITTSLALACPSTATAAAPPRDPDSVSGLS